MKMRAIGGILVAFCLLQISTAYPSFRDKIPNGHLVANPCNISEIWFGVGHKQRYGNGERNQFGLDFHGQGMQWTEDLCRMDSDGDGARNGEELGDPDCKWVPGGVLLQTQGITHPGVCTDSSGHACSEPGFELKCEGFQCESAKGTEGLEIVFNETEVTRQPKTYKCQAFALPADKDYHLVAATPHINNINHIHHMTLFGCPNNAKFEPRHTDAPYECTMDDRAGCSDPLLVWTIGDLGVCFSNEQAAWRLGKTGYKYVMIETHYHNGMLMSGEVDVSGLTLHYTETLRQNDLGVFLVGQTLLYIPPSKNSYEVSGVCKGNCIGEDLLQEEITIIGGQNHMHYRGKSGKIYIGRKNGMTSTVAETVDYHYDDPIIHMSDTPTILGSGESLGANCTYDTTGDYKTLLFGEDVNVNEMCFGYIFYYPKGGLTSPACVAMNEIDSCDLQRETIDGCEWKNLLNESHPSTMDSMRDVFDNCMFGRCLQECRSVVEDYSTNPCYSGDLRDYQLHAISQIEDGETKATFLDFWGRLDSCAINKENGGSECVVTDGSTSCYGRGVVILMLVCLLFA
ncbi:MOXD1 homolog 1-like [Mya arenaria]|uniref:MOXD1 homolog 1-like n=1 Tax=Mya arenaria TaxID=6604 RepID=UPI0022DF8F37|nr:MOXD1 homolog 1-like [Mya arenaria]